MEYSRTKIDKAGDRLAKEIWKNDNEYLDCEIIFDEYRKVFIEPLTEVTLKLHSWLLEFGCDFYIAQRLKRKPQILRKLKRFSIRLTQLQDIGGIRIIELFGNCANLAKFSNNFR
jgi:(p)ppGpp synthase/HD superfamily hydrolase